MGALVLLRSAMRLILALVFVLLFTPLSGLRAQVTPGGISPAPQILLSPAYPNPYENVTATLDDYAVDASGAVVTWKIGGVVQKSFQNQRSITFTVGAPGVQVPIEATLTPNSGPRLFVKNIINPAYLDVVVEPQTRVPPFYRGRALPSFGSSVNLTAVVNAGKMNNENLVYTWTVNNSVLFGGSVRGQNQVSVSMPRGEVFISVTVERVGGGVVASQTIILFNSQPFLAFYGINTLYGLQTRPVGDTLALIGNSTNVRAEPYYLDLRTYNRPNILEWSLGGQITPGTAANPYEITLVRQGGSAPTTVGFHVRNTTEVLQGAQSSFTVE